jgi:DnaK suppressor protein
MTRTQLNEFQTILNARHAELVRELARRDGLTIERTADALDEVRLAAERDLTTRGLERGSALLRNVRAALARVDDGSYGTCLECDEEISQKRLMAMPWASLCIACQEQADRNTACHFESQSFLRKAA